MNCYPVARISPATQGLLAVRDRALGEICDYSLVEYQIKVKFDNGCATTQTTLRQKGAHYYYDLDLVPLASSQQLCDQIHSCHPTTLREKDP